MDGEELTFFSERLVVDVQLQLNVEISSLIQIYRSKGSEGLHDVWLPSEAMGIHSGGPSFAETSK